MPDTTRLVLWGVPPFLTLPVKITGVQVREVQPLSGLDAALQSVGTIGLLAAAVTLAARLHYLSRLPSRHTAAGRAQDGQDDREAA